MLLSLALRWGQDAGLSVAAALSRVTSEPVRLLGDSIGALSSSAGRIVEGGVADLCLFDADEQWSVRPGTLISQGQHTPFGFDSTGMALPGRVRMTLVAGGVAYDARPR